jgi:hypothetical protein
MTAVSGPGGPGVRVRSRFALHALHAHPGPKWAPGP